MIQQVTAEPARLIGLSTDAKPTINIPEGSTFYTADTQLGYLWHDGQWYQLL